MSKIPGVRKEEGTGKLFCTSVTIQADFLSQDFTEINMYIHDGLGGHMCIYQSTGGYRLTD